MSKFSFSNFGDSKAGTEPWRKQASLSGKQNEARGERKVQDLMYVLNNGLSIDKDGKLVVSDKFKQQAYEQGYDFKVEQNGNKGVTVRVNKQGSTYKTINLKGAALVAADVEAALYKGKDQFKTGGAAASPTRRPAAALPAAAKPVLVISGLSPTINAIAGLDEVLSNLSHDDLISEDSRDLITQLKTQIQEEDFLHGRSRAAVSNFNALLKRDDISADAKTRIKELAKDLGMVLEPETKAEAPKALVFTINPGSKAPFNGYAELSQYVTQSDSHQHKAITHEGSLTIGCTAGSATGFGFATEFVHYSIEDSSVGPLIKAQRSDVYRTYTLPNGEFTVEDFNNRLKEEKASERSVFSSTASGRSQRSRAYSPEENLAQVELLAREEARYNYGDKPATKLLEAYKEAVERYNKAKAAPSTPIAIPVPEGFRLPANTNAAPVLEVPTVRTNSRLQPVLIP